MRALRLDGQVFGLLTVLRRAPNGNKKTHHSRWECVCVCGGRCVVVGNSLVTGHTTSCGCKKGIVTAERNRNTPYRKYEDPTVFLRNQTINNYKQAAKRRKIPWLMQDADAAALFEAPCTYCGVPPSNTWKTTNAKNEIIIFRYGGIDRVDNQKGYELGNVVACCATCNYAKRKMTTEEFRSWVCRVYNHIRQKESICTTATIATESSVPASASPTDW